MDSAACIGCGACVAACKNAAAHLFTSAKITHLALLPQGEPERELRVVRMVEQMEAEGFGNCSNEGECEAVCPKLIPISNIAKMVREYTRACGKVRAPNARAAFSIARLFSAFFRFFGRPPFPAFDFRASSSSSSLSPSLRAAARGRG